jgi:hypothetical protein
MPDTKGFDTPFKDYVAPKPSYTVADTCGTDPAQKPTDSGVSGSVTPKELPKDNLFHIGGKK